MSPEQVSGRPELIGVPSHVYSLGVLLHQILASSLPIDIDDVPLVEAARRISESAPRRLGELWPDLRGDLETITATALEKDPKSRYASAADLAADLAADVQRFLRHEPILVRPPSTAYRFVQFVRRHRVAVAGITAVIVSLVAGLVGSRVLYVRARDAELEATSRREETEVEAADATAARDFFHEMLMPADSKERPDGKVSLAELLERAAERVDSDLSAHDKVRAGIHHTLGELLSRFESFEKAETHLMSALEIYDRLYGPNHHLVGYVHVNLAKLEVQPGRLDAAEKRCELVLSMRSRTLRRGRETRARVDRGLPRVRGTDGEERYHRPLESRELRRRHDASAPPARSSSRRVERSAQSRFRISIGSISPSGSKPKTRE